MNRLSGYSLIVAGCLAAALSGCVSTQPAKVKADVPPIDPARKDEVVAQFEAQRDQAQLQAALNRWKEGNVAACERALAILVERRPNFVDARVQYAELLMAKDNPAAAEHQLRTALQLAPDRADIHHSLGMALNASGNLPAAAEQFRKAAELEPSSPVYQMAIEGL